MELSKQEMELSLPLTDSDQKAYFTKSSPFLPRSMNKIFKTGNGIIQTGNGIILPTSRPLRKNFFYKMFLIYTKGFEIDFQNRKQNYPNRKWNYLSHFQASNQKTSFTKCFSFIPRSLKLIFKTGNRIIQTGNGIIYPIFRPLIKKLPLHSVSHFYRGLQN